MFLPISSYASESNLFEYTKSINKSDLNVGTEFSQVSSAKSSLSGFGINVRYLNSFSKNWSLGVGLSQAFSIAGQGSVLYTGLSAQGHYAILGYFQSYSELIKYNGETIAKIQSKQSDTLAVGISIDQLLLNSSTQVIPATGVSFRASYSTQLFGFYVKPEVSFGQLSAQQNESLSVIKLLLLASFPI